MLNKIKDAEQNENGKAETSFRRVALLFIALSLIRFNGLFMRLSSGLPRLRECSLFSLPRPSRSLVYNQRFSHPAWNHLI
jgi:hypothetical protein